MALRFIFGSSGSGKSHYLYEQIIKESMKFPKRKYIVLVPEQFTLQTQRELVLRNPRHGILNIDVLSFARLAFRVLEETGEDRRILLDDEGKNLILRKIAGRLAPSLHVLNGKLKKNGYISEVKSVISEFSQYDIAPADLDEMVRMAGEHSYLSYKLQDIQLLYQAFEEFLAEKYITQEETLELLARKMKQSKLFQDTVIAFDGFTGFTPVQHKVLREMLSCCREVLVTVTIDADADPYRYRDPYELFAMSKQMVTSLVRIAEEEQCVLADPVCLFAEPVYRFRTAPALAHLEREIFRDKKHPWKDPQEQIRIYSMKHPKEEVLFAAQEIRRLVRTKGYRYHEIAVITGDLNVYGDEIERIFQSYEIPTFMDYKRSILLNPFVEYIRSILAMAEKQFSGESVIRFLRTGLNEFTRTEVDLLENYLRALGIKGYKRWQEKWIRRGKGTTEEELERLNHLRVSFVEKIDALTGVLKQKRKTVRDISEALYTFFVQEELQKKLKEQELRFVADGELVLAKEYAQIYKVVLDLLDKFVSLLGEEVISVKDYAKLLDAGMEEAKIGVIPPGIDEVVIGDIERTRLTEPKALLFLGGNDSLIPGKYAGGGLLTERERMQFEEKGITLAPGAKEKAYIQKFYLYLHMTKPTETFVLTYSRVSADGTALRPSYLVGDLKQLFPSLHVTEWDAERIESQELVPEMGLPLLIKGLRAPEQMEDAQWQALYRWYMNQEAWKETACDLVAASRYQKPEDSLSRETAERLFGMRQASVSRLQEFASCAYAHFLKYGLRLQKREEYQFETLDYGTILHHALEKYAQKLEQNQLQWGELSEERQDLWIEEAVEESIVDYNNTILYSSARNTYRIPRMKRVMKRSVWAMTKQLQRGAFLPDGYEVNFGSGKIDRIDVCEDGDNLYVKVLDYKTGMTTFDMTAFYHGLQLQLAVYMGEALRLEEKKHPGKQVVPAGIFYYHLIDPIVEKQVDTEQLENAILNALKLDGLVNSEEAVIQKLDASFVKDSNVIPVTKTAKGYAKYSKLLTSEEFAQVIEFAKQTRIGLQEQMTGGDTEARPYQLDQRTACTHCPYQHICQFDERIPGYAYKKLERMSREEVLKKIQEENRGKEK